MPRRKITAKIENGKVVFSKEIMEYFEKLRNSENSEWIDKYFEVLSDKGNLNATKYHKHHIHLSKGILLVESQKDLQEKKMLVPFILRLGHYLLFFVECLLTGQKQKV